MFNPYGDGVLWDFSLEGNLKIFSLMAAIDILGLLKLEFWLGHNNLPLFQTESYWSGYLLLLAVEWAISLCCFK